MAGTVVNVFLLSLLSTLFTASALCVIGPTLTALGVMFWHWHNQRTGRLFAGRRSSRLGCANR